MIFVLAQEEFVSYQQSLANQTRISAAVYTEATNMIAQNQERLDVEFTKLQQRLSGLSAAVNDMALSNFNESQAQLQILQLMNDTSRLTEAMLETYHEQVEWGLQTARLHTAALDELRLDTILRRADVAGLSLLKQRIVNYTQGLLKPFVSEEEPGLDGLGFVPLSPGDDLYFFKATIVYNTLVDPTQVAPPVDTDIENLQPATSSADTARLQQYQTIVGSSPTLFVNLRQIYLYCTPVTHTQSFLSCIC